MKTKIMSLLGLMVMGITAAYGSEIDQPKMNGKLRVTTMSPEEIRYTGKPYSKALGAYVFNYRNYDPQTARWTTPDPSGFLDGPNDRSYAPVPTNDLDYQGLLKWSTLQATGRQWTPTLQANPLTGFQGFPSTYDEYTIMANDGSTALHLYKYLGGVPLAFASDWSYNCAGYVFGNSNYWINPIASFGTPSLEAILKADGHKKIPNPPYAGAVIALWGNDHIANVTGHDNTSITEVTGKRGGEMNLKISTPEVQWTGAPTYWE